MSATNFARLGVPDRLAQVLAGQGIVEPFPIQSATIPDALAGRDVLGRAPTGSGKTLAFGLPLLTGLDRATPRRPRALVLAPTRELAEQIRKELHPLASAARLRVAVVYGGVSYGPQRGALRKGADVLVATPGRLVDLIESGDVELSAVERVVVDEADRMSDMGFLPVVRRLLDMTARDRQTLLFSATLDGDVAVLTRDYQREPVTHDVGGADPEGSDARHFFWRVEQQDRIERTARLVATSSPSVVFTRTRHGADRLARQLQRAGVDAVPIHGGRSQNQRDRALRDFSAGRVEALIATDVAARGIHVDGVASVVHYDPPDGSKTYLHRSGRTARAGAGGVVVSLVMADQVGSLRTMQRELGMEGRFDQPAADGSPGEGGVLLDRIPELRPVGAAAAHGRRRKPGTRTGGGHGGASNRRGDGGRPQAGAGRNGGRRGSAAGKGRRGR